MPDIRMCANASCPKRLTCYRFTATPSRLWQPYGDFQYEERDGACYWPPPTPVPPERGEEA